MVSEDVVREYNSLHKMCFISATYTMIAGGIVTMSSMGSYLLEFLGGVPDLPVAPEVLQNACLGISAGAYAIADSVKSHLTRKYPFELTNSLLEKILHIDLRPHP